MAMTTDPADGGRQTARRHRRRQAAEPSGVDHAEAEASPEDRIRLVLSRIPRGRVTTYGAIARLAGMPRHARLVGRTLAALPDDSRLPWHRVVNASRRLSPRGTPDAVAEQRRRLEAEGVGFTGERVGAEFFWNP
jgi:methylated-DNA-protein-cysteine methyltransferase-like protein